MKNMKKRFPELSSLGESTGNPVSIQGVSRLVREVSEYQNGHLPLDLLERGVTLCRLGEVGARGGQH